MSATNFDSCTFRVRRFRRGESAQLFALFRHTVERINCRDYSPSQIAAWSSGSVDLSLWEQQFQSRFTVVAEGFGQVAGFADLELDGHLDRFYVHADHQRQGIGQKLLGEIEQEARRLNLPRIFTEASITARPFFERHGFVLLAQQEVHRRGETFINFRMAKPLRALSES